MPNPIITVEEATGGVLEELEDAFFDIPFENRAFQNRVFVVFVVFVGKMPGL